MYLLIFVVAAIILRIYIQSAKDKNESGANLMNYKYSNDNKSDENDGAKRHLDEMTKRFNDDLTMNPAYSSVAGNIHNND